jgi:hypothetical protein
MDYSGDKFIAQGVDINKFFYPLEPSKMTFSAGALRSKERDEKRIESTFYSTEALTLEINKIVI